MEARVNASDFGLSAEHQQDPFAFLLKSTEHDESIRAANTVEAELEADVAPAKQSGSVEQLEGSPADCVASAYASVSGGTAFAASFTGCSASAEVPESISSTCPAVSAAALLSSPVALSLLAAPCRETVAGAHVDPDTPQRGSHVHAASSGPPRAAGTPRRQAQVSHGIACGTTHPLDDAVSRIEARVLQQHQGERHAEADDSPAQSVPSCVQSDTLPKCASASSPPCVEGSNASDQDTAAGAAPASSSPAASRVTWSPGFRLPLGAEGRQVLLRRLRRAYHASHPETRDAFLASHGLVFSRMPFATVSELFHLAHLLGVFDFAVQCSEEFGGVSSAAAVAAAGGGGRAVSRAVASASLSSGAGGEAGKSGDAAAMVRVGSGVGKRRRLPVKRHAAPAMRDHHVAPRRRPAAADAQEVFEVVSGANVELGASAFPAGCYEQFDEHSADAGQLHLAGERAHPSVLSSSVSSVIHRTPTSRRKRRRRAVVSHAAGRLDWSQQGADAEEGTLRGWAADVSRACMPDGSLSDICSGGCSTADNTPCFGAERSGDALAKARTGNPKELLQMLQELGLFSGVLDGGSSEIDRDTEKCKATAQALQMQLEALSGGLADSVEKPPGSSSSTTHLRAGAKRSAAGFARSSGVGSRKRSRDMLDGIGVKELGEGDAHGLGSSQSVFSMHQVSHSDVARPKSRVVRRVDAQLAGHAQPATPPLSAASSLSSLTEEAAPMTSLEALLASSLAATVGSRGTIESASSSRQACGQPPAVRQASGVSSAGRDFFQFVDDFKARMDEAEDAATNQDGDAPLEELSQEQEDLLRSFFHIPQPSQHLHQKMTHEATDGGLKENQEALLINLLKRADESSSQCSTAFSATRGRGHEIDTDAVFERLGSLVSGATEAAAEPVEKPEGLLPASLDAVRSSPKALSAPASRQCSVTPVQDSYGADGPSDLLQLLQDLPAGYANLLSAGQPSRSAVSMPAANIPAPASTNAQYALGLQFLHLMELFQLQNSLNGLLGALPKVQEDANPASGLEELKRTALEERDDGTQSGAYECGASRATPLTTGEPSGLRNGSSWSGGSGSSRSRSGSFSERTTASCGPVRSSSAAPGYFFSASGDGLDGTRSSFSTSCSEELSSGAPGAASGEASSCPSDEECLRSRMSRRYHEYADDASASKKREEPTPLQQLLQKLIAQSAAGGSVGGGEFRIGACPVQRKQGGGGMH
ncbi:hypothetical protein BESB_031250 [Besnoitia besnoiti]|uniref:Uncharacterized protein n=1 Tax=Besnoitia besnoiti TaxID=94643 RepID=A0A2A9M4L5_BESBE|nr:hypothetical protein BESB_031250 [Besnoitia besnoiti]PFH31251.1 hypothetical protein BESB_031250 [Besnoitia besnoiti]